MTCAAVTAEEVLSFGAGVIRRCFVEFYLHGNHDERVSSSQYLEIDLKLYQVALDMHRLWNSTLQSLAAAQTPQPVNFRLPSGFDKVITCVNNDDTQLQSSCVNVYQISLVEGD